MSTETIQDLKQTIHELELQNDILSSALETHPAPCGHSDQYCYTEDGGRHIECLICTKKRLQDCLAKIVEAVQWERECDECGQWIQSAWFDNERLDTSSIWDIYEHAQKQCNELVRLHV